MNKEALALIVTASFLSGMIGGTLGFGFLMNITERTPAQIEKKYQSEAVKLGYGKWETDSSYLTNGLSPKVTFRWVPPTSNIIIK